MPIEFDIPADVVELRERVREFVTDVAIPAEAKRWVIFAPQLSAELGGCGLGMVQERVAAAEIDLETSRLLIWRCAWALDQGQPGRHESSLAKAHVAETVGRVVDRSVQIYGALGVSGDTQLARLLSEVRPFRIYDGPTETHLWSIARRVLRRRGQSANTTER